MEPFRKYYKVAISYIIWVYKFGVKIKIHSHAALRVSNSNLIWLLNVQGQLCSTPNSPSRVFTARKLSKRNIEHRCNNECWPISFYRRVLVNIKTIRYFSASKPSLLALHNDTFLTTDLLCCSLCVYCPLTSVMDMNI